jgi:hypothetical protein
MIELKSELRQEVDGIELVQFLLVNVILNIFLYFFAFHRSDLVDNYYT